MRIRTQYRATLILLAAVLLITSVSMIVIGRRIDAAGLRETNATAVARGASDLGYLANDFVIYGESAQRDAWRARFDSFSRDVSRLEVSGEGQALLRSILANEEHLKGVFESVVSAVGLSRGGRRAAELESLKVSWSRLAIQAQALISDSTRLARLQRAEVDRLSDANMIVAFGMLAVLALFYLATYIMLQRRTLKSISALQKGTAVIGAGRLDYRVSAGKDDEVGDLGRAFNSMTENLETLDDKVRDRDLEEVRQINTTLRLVSECNQALARATEETGLVQEICRVIQELGGYRMAWVGYVEDDESMSVRPVASAGFEEGYLDRAGITYAEGTLGNGPTGRCIRERAVRFGRDFLEDPDLAPWRERALQRGFRSSIALPLVTGSEILGALTIYSPQPDGFGGEQVRLLVELAGDLSFGITALRARSGRAAALRLAEERAVQLRALAAKLSHAEQKERRQLAGVLHDNLQQLLVGGRYSLSVLEKEGRDATEAEALRRGLSALDEAITLTRTLTGELSPPALNEKGIAAGLEWLAREMKRKHDLEVAVLAEAFEEPADQDIRVFVYESVRELLFNVVKHAGTRAAEIEIARTVQGAIRVVVNDRGKGFAPSAPKPNGFGLLKIRERLGYLGGRIDVESAPGRGARFVLTIPMAAAVEGAHPSPRALLESLRIAPAVAARGVKDTRLRVLLVDDHRIIRQGLTLLLCEEADIEVVGEAGDGEEAVAMARQLLPDVVLMDISMPGTNGVEATRRVVSENSGVRVIGLSMHEGADMEETMRAAGAVAYLTKDGPVDHLIAAIRACRVP